MSKIYPYAGFWKRFGAFVLDSIILTIPLMLLYGVWMFVALRPLLPMFAAQAGQPPTADMMNSLLKMYGGIFGFQLISLILFWLYYSWMESSRYQATLGKLVFGIKVVGESGQRISFWHATGRTLGKWISAFTLYIGFLMAGANKQKRALHDIIASTYVVDKNYQPGDLLPEVQTHYVILGVSIAGMVALFLLPFVIVILLAMHEMANEKNSPNQPSIQQRIEDTLTLSKMPLLQQLPQEQRTPYNENGFDFTFLDDGTVRAQRPENATYAFIMKPNAVWPCCQPLVPDGCAGAANVDVCTTN